MSHAAINPNYFSKSAKANQYTECSKCGKRVLKINTYAGCVCGRCHIVPTQAVVVTQTITTVSRGITYNAKTGHYTVRAHNVNVGTYGNLDKAEAAYKAVKLYIKKTK